MKKDSCRFKGQDFVLWRGTALYDAFRNVPESYGVIPDFGRGTDAYRAMAFGVLIEDGCLLLDRIEITAMGDYCPHIAGTIPAYPYSWNKVAVYSELKMPIKRSGTLVLMRDQLGALDCVSGTLLPSLFRESLELEFVAGNLIEKSFDEESLKAQRDSLDSQHLTTFQQEELVLFVEWMKADHDFRPITSDERNGRERALPNNDPFGIKVNFEQRRIPAWSERQTAILEDAARGTLALDDAFEALRIIEQIQNKQHRELAFEIDQKRQHDEWCLSMPRTAPTE